MDVGSSKLKAALYGADGHAASVYHVDSPLQGEVVRADAVLDAIALAAETVCDGRRPTAMAITGATRTHVLAGPDGQALDAITKLDDARGAEFEDDIKRGYGEVHARGMGAFHPLARLLDTKARQPKLYAAAHWQLELKDWINLQLSGIVATDNISHARQQPQHVPFEAVVTRLQLRPNLYPAPMPAASVLGSVRVHPDARLARLQGVPLVQCGFDAWCASFGMGCVRDRQVYNVSGTTEVFGSFSTGGRYMSGVSCLQWTPDLRHLGGPCLTGLATLSWFGRTFLNDSNPRSVMDCAALAGDDCPLCLPFISGERMPFWNADLSAQFLQVRSHHGLPEFARALLDGLMVFQRFLLARLCPFAESIYLSGGATALEGWVALKANAFERPVSLCAASEPSLLGATMSALAAVGVYPDIAQAQTALTPSCIVTQPDRAAAQRMTCVEQRLLPHLTLLIQP